MECMLFCRYEEKIGSDALLNLDSMRNEEIAAGKDDKESSSFDSLPQVDHPQKVDAFTASYIGDGTNSPNELKENPSFKVRIKTKGILRDPKSPSKQKIITAVEDLPSAEGDLISESPFCMEQNPASGVPPEGKGSGTSSSDQLPGTNLKFKIYDGSKRERESFYKPRIVSENFDGGIEENISDAIHYNDSRNDFAKLTTDSSHRTRSMRTKATPQEQSSVNHNVRFRFGHELVGTSKFVGNSSMEAGDDFVAGESMPTSNVTLRLRSSKNKKGELFDESPQLSSEIKSKFPIRKLSWLMLSEHEVSYRYIPQLGDAVVYLRQVILIFLVNLCYLISVQSELSLILLIPQLCNWSSVIFRAIKNLLNQLAHVKQVLGSQLRDTYVQWNFARLKTLFMLHFLVLENAAANSPLNLLILHLLCLVKHSS